MPYLFHLKTGFENGCAREGIKNVYITAHRFLFIFRDVFFLRLFGSDLNTRKIAKVMDTRRNIFFDIFNSHFVLFRFEQYKLF